MLLKDKIAVVTGAGQGIGREIALSLAREGAKVVVSDLNEANCAKVVSEIESSGVKALAVKCDVSQRSEVESLISQTVKQFKKIDILVNNAGIYPFVPFLKMTEAEWDKIIDVNLKSVFLCSQAAARQMSDNGRIINISSIASLVAFEGLSHYCASKGGVNSLTRTLALELAPQKITVNAIAPGVIDTPGAHQPDQPRTAAEETKNQTIAMIPLARLGQASDIAETAVFLASERSSYITGQVIVVDGGWTLR